MWGVSGAPTGSGAESSFDRLWQSVAEHERAHFAAYVRAALDRHAASAAPTPTTAAAPFGGVGFGAGNGSGSASSSGASIVGNASPGTGGFGSGFGSAATPTTGFTGFGTTNTAAPSAFGGTARASGGFNCGATTAWVTPASGDFGYGVTPAAATGGFGFGFGGANTTAAGGFGATKFFAPTATSGGFESAPARDSDRSFDASPASVYGLRRNRIKRDNYGLADDAEAKRVQARMEARMQQGESEEQQPPPANMRTLATVELQHALSFLASTELLCASRVARVWHAAVDSPLAWSHLEWADLSSTHLERADFLTATEYVPQVSGVAAGPAKNNPWRSSLYRRRQPVYMSIERLESATSCTAVCRHLALLDNICGLSFHHQLPNAAVLEMTASVAFPHLREADLRGCSDADEHAQPEAVRHLFQGAPRLESIRIYQWKDDYEEAFSFAPESLTRVEIGFGFDAGCLPTLAKLPHLEELILPGNVADVQFPPPTSNPFPSLLRLTVVWFSGVPDRDPERPLPQQRAKFLTALVQSMPHLRAMHLRWTVGVQKNFQAAIGEIAAWPASVVPELQHIGIPFDGTGSDLAPMYHTLLPHLPRLIAHRPVHPFCVHLCHDTPCEVDEDWRSHGHRLDDEAEEEERDEEAMEDTDFPAGGEEAMDEGDDAATVTEEQKQATESTTSHVSHPSGISFVPASSQLPLSSMLGPLRPSGTSIMLHEAAEEDADQDEDYEPAEGVSSVCEEFHLPCVRLTVTEFLDVPKTLDDDLLWQMDTAASSITQSKSELLEMIQAEQRLVDLEPYEEDANDAARTDGED